MSNFTTRVELYGEPSKQDYENLDNAMRKSQFSTSFSENRIKYELPHSEYISTHTISTLQVVELAKQAASSVWKDFGVFVTSTTVRWEYYNLK